MGATCEPVSPYNRHTSSENCFAMGIVPSALLRVAQNLVRVLNLSEEPGALRDIVWILVYKGITTA